MSSSDESDSYSSNKAPPDIRDSHIFKMQNERFKIFKSQDPENGHFDVTFEVEGKKLFANKIFLTSVSETLNVLLSERWTNKDEVIKLETYSYDNFYEFLCFLYIAHCSLNDENVFQLVDMAEFYAVPFLKEFCHEYLSSMEYNVETVEEMFEFSQKYSLDKMKERLRTFICSNFGRVINAERFLLYKKIFVNFLYSNCYDDKENFFEAVYKWTEHQVIQQKSGEDENFNLLEAVKDEFRASFPKVYAGEKWKMKSDFLINFVLEKGLFFSPEEFKSYYIYVRWGSCTEGRFELIYDMAEKQGLKKQEMSPNESFILEDSIKADLVDVIPYVSFGRMSEKFLLDYVVLKGIISKEQSLDVRKTRVCIQNGNNRICGIFNDNIKGSDSIFNLLQTFNRHTCRSWFKVETRSSKKIRFIQAKFCVPSTPSTVTKMKGVVDWYLCLDKDGVLTLKHHTTIVRSDYFLAEMKSQNEFVITPGEKTTLTARYNNLEPIL